MNGKLVTLFKNLKMEGHINVIAQRMKMLISSFFQKHLYYTLLAGLSSEVN